MDGIKIGPDVETKLNEATERITEIEQGQKEDAKKVQTLYDQLEKMDQSNIATNREQCKSTMKTLEEARKSELRFLDQVVQDNNDNWTLGQLK